MPGWRRLTGDDSACGAQNPTDKQFPGASDDKGNLSVVPEGKNIAYGYGWGSNRGSTISQTLEEKLAPNTRYSLQVEIGNRLDTKFPKYKTQLLAGGQLLAEDDHTLKPEPGHFETSIVEHATDATPAQLGQPLEIRLVTYDVDDRTGYTQAEFDNVRLLKLPASTAAKPSITLTWKTETDVKDWQILRSLSPRGPFVSIGQATAGQTSFTDEDAALQPAHTYYYRIRSASGPPAASAAVGVTTLTAPKPRATDPP
jgi:hypothetical protein